MLVLFQVWVCFCFPVVYLSLVLMVLWVGELVVRFQVAPGLELLLGLDGLKFDLLQYCPQIAGCVESVLVILGCGLQLPDSCSTRCS